MVELRRKRLWYVFALLLLALTVVNWFGIRERDKTGHTPFPGAQGIAFGDVDRTQNGTEVVVFTSSSVLVTGGVSQALRQDTVYFHPEWQTDPITAIAIGELDLNSTDQEIMVVTGNGQLLLLEETHGVWTSSLIGNLPWPAPVWTTRAMACGELDPVTQGMEVAIIGEQYDWPSLTRTNHVMIANRPDNVTWQVGSVYSEPDPLLCAAVGNLNITEAEELIFAGDQASVNCLTGENNTWQVDELFSWAGNPIESLTMGSFTDLYPDEEIGVAIAGQLFTLHLENGAWRPRALWNGDPVTGLVSTVDSGDLDPTRPGDEIVCTSTSVASGRSLYILEPYLLWAGRRSIWVLPTVPNEVAVYDFDAFHIGAEIVIATDSDFKILSNPNFFDRGFRVVTGVFFPAVILFPVVVVLFAVADRISRVATERRQHYALEMLEKGYVRCPKCKRFVPREEMEKHRKGHKSFIY
jgi:hypothetical protein